MRWQSKLLLDSAKVFVPFRGTLRRWVRHWRPFGGEPARELWTVEQGLMQVKWLTQAGIDLKGATVLEVGTGWQPLIPVLFVLAGAGRVYHRRSGAARERLDAARTGRAAIAFALIASELGLPCDAVEARLASAQGNELAATLDHLDLTYLAPCDGRSLPLPDASVDVVYSRAVLEHVPEATIDGLCHEWARILRPNGVTLHFVDTADHWASEDPRISRINFLAYSEGLWYWTGLNEQNYQNRLRHPEYVQKLHKAGFHVEREERSIDPRSLASLPRFPLAPRFRRFSDEDLATIETRLLARLGDQ